MEQTASWVIVDKATGNGIAETFLKHVAEAVNVNKYRAVPIQEYLADLNARIKASK